MKKLPRGRTVKREKNAKTKNKTKGSLKDLLIFSLNIKKNTKREVEKNKKM